MPWDFPSEDERYKRKSDGYSLFVELITMKANNENDLKTGYYRDFSLRDYIVPVTMFVRLLAFKAIMEMGTIKKD